MSGYLEREEKGWRVVIVEKKEHKSKKENVIYRNGVLGIATSVLVWV